MKLQQILTSTLGTILGLLIMVTLGAGVLKFSN